MNLLNKYKTTPKATINRIIKLWIPKNSGNFCIKNNTLGLYALLSIVLENEVDRDPEDINGAMILPNFS